MINTHAVLLAVLLPMSGATAQVTPAPCPAQPTALPAPFAGWGARTPLPAASGTDELGRATLAVEVAVDAALSPAARITYPLALAKPAAATSRGGLFTFTVKAAGVYRVALGGSAWIDLVRNGAAVASSAHGHGPACSGIRKIVDFPLTPGRYVLQISGSDAATLPLMIVPA